MAQKPVLGKGLASLLPSMNQKSSLFPSSASGTAASDSQAATHSGIEYGSGAVAGVGTASDPLNRDRHLGISMAALEEIHANHFQPRRDFDEASLMELAQSIRTSGIIQPLLVRKSSSKDGFELIAGERRLRAAKLAGLKQVPIVIRRSTDRETLELALIENIQRQNLNCIDEALAYFQLIQDFSLTQEEVSERVGKDRATVSNYLRLLRLPEEIIEDLKNQILSFGHGKALLSLDDSEMRLRARGQIIEKKMSVRETEALVDTMKREAEEAGKTTPGAQGKVRDPILDRLTQLSRDLARQWSAKIQIKGNENKGKIVIHYSTRQELDRILEDMQTENI